MTGTEHLDEPETMSGEVMPDEIPVVEQPTPVEIGDIEPSAADLDAAAPEPAPPGLDDDIAELGLLAAPPMDPAELVGAVEAILFVVEAPVAVSVIAAALQQTTDSVAAALNTLRAGYDERAAGMELREIAGGVRLFTRPVHAGHVEQFLQDGQRSKLTQAALETLAVIAYRQPVTRARVSAIRGVNVDGVVRTLITRGLIVEVGNDPETGGGLFRTTDVFLEKMGLDSLDDLPSLAPLLPDIEGLDGVTTDDY